MAKKSKSQKQLFNLIMFVVALLAMISIALPILAKGDHVLKGFEVAFGKELLNFGSIGKIHTNVNILLIISYVAVLAAGVLALLDQNKAIVLILFVVAAILFIVSPSFTKYTIEAIIGGKTTKRLDLPLGYGAYISFGLSLLGAGISAYTFVKNYK